MIARPPRPRPDAIREFLASPQFSSALTQVIVGSAVAALLLRELIGWAGLLAILALIVVLCSLSFLARRQEFSWRSLPPTSLLLFLTWTTLTLLWSQYRSETATSLIYLYVFTYLGIYIATVRDTIQIVRAFGDVLRVVVAVSLILEIFSGILIDAPLQFLHIEGNMDTLGPLQGIFGARNQLGSVCLIAIVTFGSELRTRSIPRQLAVASLIGACALLLASQSPIAFGTSVIVVGAAGALYLLRRLPRERQRLWQGGLLIAAAAVVIATWAFRGPLVSLLSAGGEVNRRLTIWTRLRELIGLHNVEGWGWIGLWREETVPFAFLTPRNTFQPTGLNAYLDVWFQAGLAGLLIFLGMAGLAFVRSWLLASSQRSFIYAWPALMLVILLVTALADSTILFEFGWLTFVVCSVKAARELSWRKAFDAIGERRDASSE